MAALIKKDLFPFVELCAKSNFSFLEGASHPEEMIQQANTLGYSGLAIADTNGVYGVPKAHVAAKDCGFSLLCGSEILLEGQFPAVLIAKHRDGYGDLCELLTTLHREERPLTHKDLDSSGLFLFFPPTPKAETLLPVLKERFDDRFYLACHQFLDGTDAIRKETATRFSQKYDIPCIASNAPLFHIPQRKILQDALRCIQHRTTLKKAGFKLLANTERHLKAPEALYALFKEHPEWLENTLKIASACHFSLDEIRYHYPTEWIPAGETTTSYLNKLTEKGILKRYGHSPPASVRKQVDKELTLIQDLQYADYFLTTWDIVRFARSKGILCQGRGSAANSIVCYLLEITSIDPIRMDLLFERFISRERKEPPDIDIDFEHERREEVIQYLYERYGRHRAAITAEVICFRRKSALREVAKVFDIPVTSVEKFLYLTHRRHLTNLKVDQFIETAPEIPEKTLRMYLQLVHQIKSFPRHIGTHVGGFVLTHDKLSRNMPIENAAMPNRTIVQWDKNDLDALGFVRVDVLGLGMLTAIRKSFEYAKAVYNKDYSLSSIPAEDPKVYDLMCNADTVGIFQIESRAQMSMLPRLKPRNFFDLVVQISIVRPGPIQGEMVHPYLVRRAGEETFEFPLPELKQILEKTYGVPIFQEQVMAMAMVVADFSAGEADNLRRAMGTWKKEGGEKLARIAGHLEQKLIEKGVKSEFALQIVNQIKGFAEYGFPESHAASFAILAYASAYLKLYHQDCFLTGLLNSLPMGFYGASTLIHDAKRHDVTVKEVDVFRSTWDNRVESPKVVRLGLRQIRGLSKKTGQAVETVFKHKSTLTFHGFIKALRSELFPQPLVKRELFLLAFSGAFKGFGMNRREAIWEVQATPVHEELFLPQTDPPIELPKENPWQTIRYDYDSHGVSLYAHPMSYFRKYLMANLYMDSKTLQQTAKKRVKTAGVVICRQMPGTASGVLFITLEDEFGFVNLVLWKRVYEQFRDIILSHSFLQVEGKLDSPKNAKVIHLIVDKVSPLLTPDDTKLSLQSHDFH